MPVPVRHIEDRGKQVEVVLAETASDLAAVAADLVCDFLDSTRTPVLGLATGASVKPLYRQLVRRYREGSLSFGTTRAFLLDEYAGLEPGHPQRYSDVIRAELTGHVDIDPAGLHMPDGNAPDLDAECARYDDLVSRAGVGLQILGIGRNGHLAFNEPGSSFESRTRVVRLAVQTRIDNARYFDTPDEVPKHALTQGLGTIRQAGHLLVIAVGSSKAAAVRAALNGPVSPMVPASILQLHPRVTVVLDPYAARSASSRPG